MHFVIKLIKKKKNHHSKTTTSKSLAASRVENVTQTIARILDGYDIRLRPNFGGESLFSYPFTENTNTEAHTDTKQK